MKTIKYFINLFFISLFLQTTAQLPDLIGSYGFDGPTDDGYLYSVVNGQFDHFYDFTAVDNPGKYPVYGLVTEDNDTYYGLLMQNLLLPEGAIFVYTRSTNNYQIIYEFEDTQFKKPASPLVILNHKLYGIATKQDQFNHTSIIYSYDINNAQFNELYQDNSNLDYPSIGLTGNGQHLYGIARAKLFDFDLINNTFNLLHYFSQNAATRWYNADKYNIPVFSNGKLYGAIFTNGNNYNEKGILFEYDLNNQTANILHNFDNGMPLGQIVLDNNVIYGLQNSNNFLFSFDLTNQNYQVLYQFVNGQAIYGATGNGGLSKTGHNLTGFAGNTLFAYNTTSGNINALQTYNNSYYPVSNILTPVNNHEFIGLNKKGGDYKFGEIFSYDFQSSTYQNYKTLNVTPYGSMPIGQLTQLNGKIYGRTKLGGANGYGTIYELDHGNMTTLYDFSSMNMSGKILIDQNKILVLDNGDLIGIDLSTHQVQVLTSNVYSDPTAARLMKASDGYYYTLNEQVLIRINPSDFSVEIVRDDIYEVIGLNSEITEYNGKLYFFSNCACLCWPPHYGAYSYDLTTGELTTEYSYECYPTYLYFDNTGMELTECNGVLYGIAEDYGYVYGRSYSLYAINSSNNGIVSQLQPNDSFGQKLLNIGNGHLLFIEGNRIQDFDTNSYYQSVFNFPMSRSFQAYGSLSVLEAAGIENILGSKLKIYPNPAKDYVLIKNSSKYKIKQYIITDMQGKEILKNDRFEDEKINISNLSAGIYFIQLQMNNNVSITKKIIKKL